MMMHQLSFTLLLTSKRNNRLIARTLIKLRTKYRTFFRQNLWSKSTYHICMSVLDIRLSRWIKPVKQYSEIWGSHKGTAGDSKSSEMWHCVATVRGNQDPTKIEQLLTKSTRPESSQLIFTNDLSSSVRPPSPIAQMLSNVYTVAEWP
jgi:hypothetical protein